uniref:Uncharacterized protein n=1 Tax=Aplanochytrium stocchinoi TaxID=215587 RepID=A0A7S3LRA0_9STRA|mmetsp:Transcript_17003/g.21737  ORF Transcript_17003/g.21737 Transcript_17003/m.21737 type:complete len:443 (-) Transcript_17003:740-2068(-)|eukprot:CAMPEP_0204861028 /NCGR_PEP_ID=MMETSP1348-20121228/1130_1 /ASSEMBLY_ACC=CAM_ASM_000700 /TAXON_ID=215587 /ORGANISM="Aplanochytrium stocchinoi, Strain GSBS06" /LENGTH=442 /DNA_ID=CAMNT_0052010163 /DNA_START=306 /DNA_END=1634 /DNA_ORIENTATION=-
MARKKGSLGKKKGTKIGKKRNKKKKQNIWEDRAPSVASLRQLSYFKNQATLDRVSGAHPVSFKADHSDRFELFEQLRRFYQRFDKVHVTAGIGQIVDWALIHGRDELNQRLLIKYGETLDTLLKLEEEEDAREARMRTYTEESHESSETWHYESVDHEGSQMSQEHEYERKDTSNSNKPKTLREKLSTFFEKHDPNQLAIGLDDIIDVAKTDGIDALNQELKSKYDANLDDVDEATSDKVKPTVEEVKKNSAKREKKNKDRPQQPPRKPRKPKPSPGAVKLITSEQSSPITTSEKSKGSKTSLASGGSRVRKKLPDYVKHLISMYYAVYDPYKLSNGGVKVVYRWTEDNGAEALSKQLEAKYGEGFKPFVKRANELQDELVKFYTKYDKQRLVQGLEKIVKWGLKNGRPALNFSLREMYGYDLNWETAGNVDVSFDAITPDF